MAKPRSKPRPKARVVKSLASCVMLGIKELQMIIKVRAEWDSEAKVWYVEDSNVPGLHIEAETREKLYEKLPGAIEDLLGSGEREVEFIAKIAA